MRWAFAGLLVIHGLIHLMGFAKAFGYAELAALTQPISRSLGALWLLAALMFLATAAVYLGGVRGWWALGMVALVVSQGLVFVSWTDARWGTIANLLVLAGVLVGAAMGGPTSLPAELERELDSRLEPSRRAPARPIAASDLEALPAPVRRYLEATGAARLPRPLHLFVRFSGRIRGDAKAPWMPFVGQQHSFYGAADGPVRLFFMDATMMGLPVQVFHRYAHGEASMRVRMLGLVPITSASGEAMTRAETVTLLNDACLLAPGAMIDPAMRWEALDARRARATYTNGAHTISAEVTFGDDGMIADFVSDDRAMMKGREAIPCRWSTPMREVRAFGPQRLASVGEGMYHPPEGAFAYLEMRLDDVVVEPTQA